MHETRPAFYEAFADDAANLLSWTVISPLNVYLQK